MHQLETSILNVFCFVIDTASALVIVGYCTLAFITALRSGRTTEAHGIVARGAILGMSIKLVGTTLKTIELQTWNQIGLFAVIFLLRTILKKFFQLENKIAARKEQVSS
ncbi:MAG: DUF1622 domain-containing protein [Desulfomonilaceae bacterium]